MTPSEGEDSPTASAGADVPHLLYGSPGFGWSKGEATVIKIAHAVLFARSTMMCDLEGLEESCSELRRF